MFHQIGHHKTISSYKVNSTVIFTGSVRKTGRFLSFPISFPSCFLLRFSIYFPMHFLLYFLQLLPYWFPISFHHCPINCPISFPTSFPYLFMCPISFRRFPWWNKPHFAGAAAAAGLGAAPEAAPAARRGGETVGPRWWAEEKPWGFLMVNSDGE